MTFANAKDKPSHLVLKAPTPQIIVKDYKKEIGPLEFTRDGEDLFVALI